MDILVEKLVQKGIINAGDAREILNEVKEEAKKEREIIVEETKASLKNDGSLALNLPGWVERTKLKGDLRLRYQTEDRHTSSVGDGKVTRNRFRYRLRLGVMSEVTDKVDVGFGLATGSDDPRSTNQTMQDGFETPDIRLDYAYVAYKPFDGVTLTGGKMHNPIWKPSDLLWDGDIKPEGAAIQYKKKMDNAELFFNGGAWVLDEWSNNSSDPYLFVAQPGYKINLGDSAYFKNAVAYYYFANEDDVDDSIDNRAGTNTPGEEFDALSVSAELGCKTGVDAIPFVALFGDYVKNVSDPDSDEDTGYLLGVKFGHKKVKKAKQWQIKALYRELEQDAWYDGFPDSDSYGGDTGVEGYELVFKYGITKNVSFAVDYYSMEQINGSSEKEDLIQLDLNFKF